MKINAILLTVWFLGFALCGSPAVCYSQTLEAELQQADFKQLADNARKLGDASRGAILFFQPHMACSKCHSVIGAAEATAEKALGPDLGAIDKTTTDELLVESVLLPSKTIRKGFESISILTVDGTALSALLVERTAEKVVVKDVSRGGEKTTIPMEDIEAIKDNDLSLMPTGQVNQLNSHQQFYDLIKYLIEIRDGGSQRAQELQPAASLIALKIPEYESHVDHAGIIRSWDTDSLKRGEAIYLRVCANCHGTKDQAGSLPTSLRFAEGKFKNGSDPLSIYRTLTQGFGLMVPQTWMVPSQKYDVIHYIRESYLKSHNESQLTVIDKQYLDKLPPGDTFGPEPSSIEVWSAMDYGPTLAHTLEAPGAKHNFAYKGISVRLDPGVGGVSRGQHWMVFDTDTLRTAAGWSSSKSAGSNSNFMDWKGIQFNGQHQIHPQIVGKNAFTNSTGPGWADPKTESFVDDQRVLGRDGKQYGPLPREWGRFKGLYHYGHQAILSYSIGSTEILELPRLQSPDNANQSPLMVRTFNIGPRDRDLVLQVAEHTASEAQLSVANAQGMSIAKMTVPSSYTPPQSPTAVRFDGSTFLQANDLKDFDLVKQDFSVVSRIKTKEDGTIWSTSEGGEKWIPNGQSLFIRDGRLVFDIGWVGAVSAKSKVSDGRWHMVALTWNFKDKKVQLYVDGKLDGEGTLAAKAALSNLVFRIGFTATDFPRPKSYFTGDMSQIQLYQRRLTAGLGNFKDLSNEDGLLANWKLDSATGDSVVDSSKHKRSAGVSRVGDQTKQAEPLTVIAGVTPSAAKATWTSSEGRLRLRIPAGDQSLRFSVWQPTEVSSEPKFEELTVADADLDLNKLIHGGPPRWPQTLTSESVIGSDNGPFAVDVLTAPESNPWLAQMRFTGLDFFDDGRIAACTWDGDVWIVTPSNIPNDRKLSWQRVASGLFQPLGLKIVAGKIHLICRDQLAVLHDLNGDGETDFYECLNNDHQVTEHFHEFAMGLQTDAEGNFYYAKSGCHAKAAVVPHHGTLLRVSPDGSSTEILANGFRAANGVCLNPDGSFVVTDQEGFWNPKNRINWVTLNNNGKPNFYGNMLGYHDVTDASDSAMVQPLCWITNAFDRSPAELLWVDSDRWGPLKGSLLNLSYGYGKVYLVPHEKVEGAMQGGMIELPIPLFPTGIMRGRFHPADGQLYLCGMFAWAGNATHPGGLYRLRATGQPSNLPVGLQATQSGIKLTFTEAIDPSSLDSAQISIKTWGLKRTANYGSKHFDEQSLKILATGLSEDGKTVTLNVAELQPTWCMEIQYAFRSASGSAVKGTIHNTIHKLGE